MSNLPDKYGVLDVESIRLLDTIADKLNPEIHHYHRGSHPGASWYIKTVVPQAHKLTGESRSLADFWDQVASNHPDLILITDQAYDWDGIAISGWRTIWANNRIDIIWNRCPWDGFSYRIVDFNEGLNQSGLSLLGMLGQYRELGNIGEIAGFLSTYTTEKNSNSKRKNIRVLDDEGL